MRNHWAIIFYYISIRLILNIFFKALHIPQKTTKFGSQNFGYQIWFCTRLMRFLYLYCTYKQAVNWRVNWLLRAYFLSLAQSKLRLCSANYRAGYFSNQACDWLSISGPILKAFGRVQYTPFQLADKSPMIADQHTEMGSVSQLSQLANISHWLTLSTKDITTSFWHYNKLFWFLSNHIMGWYHFSNPIE